MQLRRASVFLAATILLGCRGAPSTGSSSSDPTSPASAQSASAGTSAATPGAPGNSDSPASAGAAAGTGATASPSGSLGSATSPATPVIAADPAAAERVRPLAQKPPRPRDGKGAGFAGPVDVSLDTAWITRLASTAILEVTPNRGGSSISMRVKFADGTKAALKPEQTGKPTDPRSEIAAYHIDRLLGFGRTAAVVGRRFALSDLRSALVTAHADPAFLDRVDHSLVVRDGHVDVAMIAWHTAPLAEEESAPAWTAALATRDSIPAADAPRLAEWSDLVVFDFLIDNPDRYSGGNILRLGKAGPLVFLDQGAAFGKNRARQGLTTKDRLDTICRFRKGTLAALSRTGPDAPEPESLRAQLEASLARDPIAPVLDGAQLSALEERAGLLAGHVRGCAKKLGPASTLPNPP